MRPWWRHALHLITGELARLLRQLAVDGSPTPHTCRTATDRCRSGKQSRRRQRQATERPTSRQYPCFYSLFFFDNSVYRTASPWRRRRKALFKHSGPYGNNLAVLRRTSSAETPFHTAGSKHAHKGDSLSARPEDSRGRAEFLQNLVTPHQGHSFNCQNFAQALTGRIRSVPWRWGVRSTPCSPPSADGGGSEPSAARQTCP